MVNVVKNFIFKWVFNVLYKKFCIELVFVLKFVFEVVGDGYRSGVDC